MQLFLFTDTFPYGFAEPFLESEVPFLAEKFEHIHIIPLSGKGKLREVPENVSVWKPLLDFSPKNKWRLLMGGIFNFSPFCFAFKEFFKKQVYHNSQHLWQFFTSLLLFRAMFVSIPFSRAGEKFIQKEDRFYFYWGDKAVLLAPFLKKNFSKNKFLARFHGSDLYEEAHHNYIPFRKNTLAAVNICLPVSQNGRDYLKNRYKIDEKYIHSSPLGVFDRGLNPATADNTIFQLVSCSNMIPVKRLPLIVEALRLIDFPLKWTHIGAGSLQNIIIESAGRLPQNIQTHFTGQLSNSEVIKFYQENPIDLFINVSASEGLPVSIMEALSFGIPAAATDVGGTSELVDDTVGYLFPANVSPAEIAAVIRRLSSSADRQILRKNARQRWAERCNAEKNYRAFAEYMLSVGAKNFSSLQRLA